LDIGPKRGTNVAYLRLKTDTITDMAKSLCYGLALLALLGTYGCNKNDNKIQPVADDPNIENQITTEDISKVNDIFGFKLFPGSQPRKGFQAVYRSGSVDGKGIRYDGLYEVKSTVNEVLEYFKLQLNTKEVNRVQVGMGKDEHWESLLIGKNSKGLLTVSVSEEKISEGIVVYAVGLDTSSDIDKLVPSGLTPEDAKEIERLKKLQEEALSPNSSSGMGSGIPQPGEGDFTKPGVPKKPAENGPDSASGMVKPGTQPLTGN
jgi:hypothetical protein